MEQQVDRHSFQRVLGRTDVLALSIGTMIGWGWLALSGYWVATGGVAGSVAAFILGAIIFILIGNVYAELAAALPVAGGEIAFSYRALGYYFSVFVGWTITFAYIGVAAWEGVAISTALAYLFPDISFPWVLIGVIGAIGVTLLNYFGPRPATIFQVIITSAMMLSGFLFFFTSVSFGDIANAEPFFTDSWGMITVLLIVPSMLLGFDIIPQFTEEMNIVPKQIGKLLVFSIFLCSTWYILIIIGVSLAAPIEVRMAGLLPVADAMAYSMSSPVFGKIMIFGGILGIFSSWNGFMVAATRILFAMGRAHMIPPIFGKLHSRYKTPTAAIFLVGGLCALAPLFGEKALLWLVNISSFEAVISYMMIAISFLILRKAEPKMERPYIFRSGAPLTLLVILILLVLLLLYTPAGLSILKWPYEWLVIMIWYLIGAMIVLYSRLTYSKITETQREVLIFGERYSRDV